jgi:AraC-like DNA-binding protein
MKRAAQIFDFEEDETDSPLVEKVWSSQSAPHDEFVAVAESNWQFVVTTYREQTMVVAQGPSVRARVTPIPQGAEFFGVVLPLGTFMPSLSLAGLVGGAELFPEAGSRKFWLAGSRWEIPTAQNADVFVRRLMQEDVLARDGSVARALESDDDAFSRRTMQRRVRRATGTTQSVIRQMSRAYVAVDALGSGTSPSKVATDLGYADQPHLTRSLSRFIGQTPAQVLNTGAHWCASTRVRSIALARQ